MSRHIGKFRVSGFFFANCTKYEGANLFHRMIVLGVENSWDRDERIYIAIHEQFREVDRGEIIPFYEATDFDEYGYPTWKELEE